MARSISTSPVPKSLRWATGNFTIADFVADLRAPTPTAAAEIAVPRKSELVGQVMDLEEQLARCMWRRLELAKENWRGFVKRLADPERKLRETQQRVDGYQLTSCAVFEIACVGSKTGSSGGRAAGCVKSLGGFGSWLQHRPQNTGGKARQGHNLFGPRRFSPSYLCQGQSDLPGRRE